MLLGKHGVHPAQQANRAGHSVADVGYGQVETCARHLMRWPYGRYDLRRVAADFEASAGGDAHDAGIALRQ